MRGRAQISMKMEVFENYLLRGGFYLTCVRSPAEQRACRLLAEGCAEAGAQRAGIE